MFGLSLFSVIQYWNYEETFVDISKQLHLNVSNKDLRREIETAIDASRFDDARMYLDIAKSYQYQLNYHYYYSEIDAKDTQLNRVSTQISNFTSGFIEGKSTNLAGIAGSVSADFTVVGDVRDLYHEYQKYEKGDDVNELIVALSGAGIGLTAMTIGSLGSLAPVKAGTSILKTATKTQKITLRFQKYLLKHGRRMFDWAFFTRAIKNNKTLSNIRVAAKQAYHPEAMDPLKVIAKQVNNIRKSTSTADTVHLLKYVETTDDLRHLEKATVKYGSKTKGIIKLLGKGAIRTIRVLKKTAELLFSLLFSVISALSSLFLLIPRYFL